MGSTFTNTTVSYDSLYQDSENGVFNHSGFNEFVLSAISKISALYRMSFDVGRSLDRKVEFSHGRYGFYLDRITSVIESIGSATFSNKRTFLLPFKNLHYFDMSQSNAHVDVESSSVRINKASNSKQINMDQVLDSKSVSVQMSSGQGNVLEFSSFGSTPTQMFSDYYNYYRYIIRSPKRDTFSAYVLFDLNAETYITNMELGISDVVTYDDTVVVYKKTPYTGTDYVEFYRGYIHSKHELIDIYDSILGLKVEIIKKSNDGIYFDHSIVYFDYYFTIRYLKLYESYYYHQNFLVTKPINFGDGIDLYPKSHVRFRVQDSQPYYTLIRYMYKISKLGEDNSSAVYKTVKDKDRIDLIPMEMVLVSQFAHLKMFYKANYGFLDIMVKPTDILNGGIYVFGGSNSYGTITDNVYKFWLVLMEDRVYDIYLPDTVSDLYIDFEAISTRVLSLPRGFYNITCKSTAIGSFVTQLLEMSGTYIAKDRMTFGWPSVVLQSQYDKGFTVVMRNDGVFANIAVPTTNKYDTYLVIYDKKKGVEE